MKTITKSLLLAVVMTMAASAVFAQTATDTFAVTANVAGSCRISTAAGDITFGAYLPWDADRTLSTTLGVQCIRGTSATMSWVGQNDATATVGTNAMTTGVAGAANLEYDLSFVYGSALVNGDSIASMFVDNSSAKTININATLLGGQELVAAGSYTDNVTVTIEF